MLGSGFPPKEKSHVFERLWHCLLYVGSTMKQPTIGATATSQTRAANHPQGSARAFSRLSKRADKKGKMQVLHEKDRCSHMHGLHHVSSVTLIYLVCVQGAHSRKVCSGWSSSAAMRLTVHIVLVELASRSRAFHMVCLHFSVGRNQTS